VAKVALAAIGCLLTLIVGFVGYSFEEPPGQVPGTLAEVAACLTRWYGLHVSVDNPGYNQYLDITREDERAGNRSWGTYWHGTTYSSKAYNWWKRAGRPKPLGHPELRFTFRRMTPPGWDKEHM